MGDGLVALSGRDRREERKVKFECGGCSGGEGGMMGREKIKKEWGSRRGWRR